MLEIQSVTPFSIAAELGIEPGDSLVAINGVAVRDLVDYCVADVTSDLLLEIERSDGEVWEFEIEKDPDEPVGLVLPHPEPMHCGNQCIFCFVHQLPPGMRPTLYVKDEDYRFSYLYGAYVTLSNIAEKDVCRIIEQKLSPLYVSVHATDEVVRERLLGRQSPPILPVLQRLVNSGIELHTQIVVCPGMNDGEVLEKTFQDLYQLGSGVCSLALVPVALTSFREKLPKLEVVDGEQARHMLTWVHEKQRMCLAETGSRFLYAADELYLRAGSPFPALDEYEDLPQIENGGGLVPQFRVHAAEVLAQVSSLQLPRLSVVTGVDAASEIEQFASDLKKTAGVSLQVLPVRNLFFGGNVTVAGLITGQDILQQLPGRELGDILLLPDVLLREEEDVLLDDVTVADLEKQLNIRIEVFPPDPYGLWDLLEALDMEFSSNDCPLEGEDHV